jgi:hypothetical protein
VQRILFVAGAVLTMGPSAWGQLGSVKDTEMCRQDPANVLCNPGKPIEFQDLKVAPARPLPRPVAAETSRVTPAHVVPATIDLTKVDWRFAHPKPDLLLSINVGSIVRSPFLAQSLQESFNMTSDVDRAKIDLILKMVGTVERVQVSLHSTQVKNDPDFLVLVTGHLDSMVRQMLTQQSKGSAVVSREISSNAILFGKASLIDQAVRRMSGVTAPFIANDLSSSDLWIAGDTGLLKGSTNTPLPPGVDTLKRFSLGMNFRDPVELNINLSMLNEDGAEKMMAMYNLLTAQAAQTPEAAVLVNASKVDRQGSEIHFRFSAPLAMLQSQMKSAGVGKGAAGLDLGAGRLPALLGMLGMQPAAAPTATLGTSPAPVVRQNPGKIMIYGLDDGPREVAAPKKSE